jgi:hypothetical protein
MIESKTTKLKPTTLRLLLAIVMFLIATLATVGFIFAQKAIGAYAIEVSHKKTDATASENSLQTLKSIEKQLQEDRDIINKAKNIKHNNSLPQFKAVEDVQNHARANGLSLSDISFETVSSTPTTPGTTPTSPTSAAPAATIATPAVNGVSVTFIINGGKVDINKFISFLHDIERSTPKMQISGISVKKGDSNSQIAVESMTVTMLTGATQ